MKHRFIGSRVLSGILSASMAITMMPNTALTSFAAEEPILEALGADGDGDTLGGEETADQSESYRDSRLAMRDPKSDDTHVKFYVIENEDNSGKGTVAAAAPVGTLAGDTTGAVVHAGSIQFNSYLGYDFYLVPEFGYTWVDTVTPVELNGAVSVAGGAADITISAETTADAVSIRDIETGEKGMPGKSEEDTLDDAYGKFDWTKARVVHIKGIGDESKTGTDFMSAYIQAENADITTHSVKNGLTVDAVEGAVVPRSDLQVKVYEYDPSQTLAADKYSELASGVTVSPVTYGGSYTISLKDYVTDWKRYKSIGLWQLTRDSKGVVTSVVWSDGSDDPSTTAKADISNDAFYESDASKYNTVKDAVDANVATNKRYYIDETERTVNLSAALGEHCYATKSSTKEIAVVLTKQTSYEATATGNSAVTLSLAHKDEVYGAGDVADAKADTANIKLLTAAPADGSASSAVVTADAKDGRHGVTIVYKNLETNTMGVATAYRENDVATGSDWIGGTGKDATQYFYVPKQSSNMTMQAISYETAIVNDANFDTTHVNTIDTVKFYSSTPYDTYVRTGVLRQSTATDPTVPDDPTANFGALSPDEKTIKLNGKGGMGHLKTDEEYYIEVTPATEYVLDEIRARVWDTDGVKEPTEKVLPKVPGTDLYYLGKVSGYSEIDVYADKIENAVYVKMTAADVNAGNTAGNVSLTDGNGNTITTTSTMLASRGKDYKFKAQINGGYTVKKWKSLWAARPTM